MLKELSKKDKLWREIALKICGGRKALADDIVQEMYLRRMENDRGQRMTDYYIVCTMKSIYLNMIKTNKSILVSDVPDSGVVDDVFEPTDDEQELLDKASKLPYAKREMLELNYDMSLRDIQKEFNINYVFVHRSIKEARQKILGEQISRYDNKRLKHKKMKSTGFGDTIEKITKATGIKQLVELAANGKDCGCDKRKEALNRLWRYKLSPRCMEKDEIQEYKEFVDSRKFTLLGGGKAKGQMTDSEIQFVTFMHSQIFNTQIYKPSCMSCSGTAHTLIKMVYELDTVFVNNIEAEKPKAAPKKTTTKKRTTTRKKTTTKRRTTRKKPAREK